MSDQAVFYLSTYTERLPHVKKIGPGIVQCSIDLTTGALKMEAPAISARNPSYLWMNQQRTKLYAIAEVLDHAGSPGACLQVYDLPHEATNPIRERQVIDSAGVGPAYCRGDQRERYLLSVNYLAGSVHSFPINANGELGSPCSSHQLTGCGPNIERQEGPHPHSIITNARNTRAYVADLGTDRLISYAFDQESGQLSEIEAESYTFKPNSGPRHCWFHPNGRHLFITLELSSELAVLSIEENQPIKHITTLPTISDVVLENHPSELVITQDGTQIYVANRGQDTIAAFRFNAATQDLKLIGEWPCGGRIPRNIALSPDERFLVVANQESNELVSLSRNPTTGELRESGHTVSINAPCFITFT